MGHFVLHSLKPKAVTGPRDRLSAAWSVILDTDVECVDDGIIEYMVTKKRNVEKKSMTYNVFIRGIKLGVSIY